jgi:hypothetical protein
LAGRCDSKRRMAVIAGTVTFCLGVILQTANFRGIGLLTAGRFIAGVGVG